MSSQRATKEKRRDRPHEPSFGRDHHKWRVQPGERQREILLLYAAICWEGTEDGDRLLSEVYCERRRNNGHNVKQLIPKRYVQKLFGQSPSLEYT